MIVSDYDGSGDFTNKDNEIEVIVVQEGVLLSIVGMRKIGEPLLVIGTVVILVSSGVRTIMVLMTLETVIVRVMLLLKVVVVLLL